MKKGHSGKCGFGTKFTPICANRHQRCPSCNQTFCDSKIQYSKCEESVSDNDTLTSNKSPVAKLDKLQSEVHFSECPKIIVLGSTGSIGQQVLEVIEKSKGFKIIGLSAHTNKKLLAQQAKKFNVQWTTSDDPAELATKKCDLVVNAISGLAGLKPTLSALKAGNTVALANKESIVAQGAKIMRMAKPGQIIPIDSEHSSIHRCLQGRNIDEVEKIILTCSGGPFFGKTNLKNITAEQALAHPTWSMGKKISIDSATLMNKGFEIIEAHHLFGIPYSKIDVLIHPQSLVHGIVEFKDGSIMAHASAPDMRIPIAYALGIKNVSQSFYKKINLLNSPLVFHKPDHKTFKGIKIALKYRAQGEKLVKANDEAVEKFLAGEIKFIDIYKYIEKSLQATS